VKSLFARLTINLSPFAFELPIQYLPLFVALLREIGMQESLTNSYAREFLLDIKKACSYHRLNPNELHAVMEILNKNTSEGCYDSVIADDGCRLVSAASCVSVDPYGSHLLGNINTYIEVKICSPRSSSEYLQTVSPLYLLYNFNRWEDLWMPTC
jgi:sacsin